MSKPALLLELSELQMLRLSGVRHALAESPSTIYRSIAARTFPNPIELGPNRKGWPRYEVECVNRARIAGKNVEEMRAIVVALEAARKTLASKSAGEIRAFISKLIDGHADAA